MKKLFIAILLTICCGASAQTQISKYKPGVTPEGAVYFLPKTALRIVVQVEKTTYTPGDFCKYAERYLRMKDIAQEPAVEYNINTINLTSLGVADTAKCYAVKLNPKSAASNIVLTEEGILLGVNAEVTQSEPPERFVAAPKEKQLNPRQYMNEEIMTAGSTAKMAELTAEEIYEIRDSRNQLTRGQAESMPTDGMQMKLMLDRLDTEEKALTQLFTGTTVKDTTEYVLIVCPDKEIKRSPLFRLSRKLGIVDSDDLSGTPYYITVADLHSVPEPAPVNPKKKVPVSEDGIYVNVPGKIKVTISKGNSEMGNFELYAAQFGYTELLAGELFNKRFTTHIVLNPNTGAVATLSAEQPK